MTPIRAGIVRYASLATAIEIVYEDTVTLLRGCAVVARWECVVPGS